LETPTAIETPAAPVAAPTPAPATVSASLDAVGKGDFSAFHDSEAAARRGAPKPSVEAKIETPAAPVTESQAATTTPTTEARAISKRQQETNERIRQAVERATETLRRENEQLRRGPTPAQPQAQPAQREPEWKRYAAMPDAPKLAEFDSVEDHAAAMALFVADTRHAERTAHESSRTVSEQLTVAQQARVEAFGAQLEAAKTADPTFVEALTPEVRALKPFSALQPGEAGGPANVVAEQIFDSPVAPQVLRHLSTHPEALTRLTTTPASILALPPAAQAKAHIQWIVREFGKLEAQFETAEEPAVPDASARPVVDPPASPISAAPPPLPTISRAGQSVDAKAAALAKGDFAAFSQLERADRAAKRRSA